MLEPVEYHIHLSSRDGARYFFLDLLILISF